MTDQNLPDYKLKFLSQMEQLRQQQRIQRQMQQQQSQGSLGLKNRIQKKPIQNNIINTAQYSSSNWKSHLNTSSYNVNHNDSHYELNLLVNPEVKRKNNNIQSTPISQYSNAMHNKTVFVNPKNTSC